MIKVDMNMPASCADCKLKKGLEVSNSNYTYMYNCLFDNVGPVLFNGFLSDNYNYTMTRHPKCPLKEEG